MTDNDVRRVLLDVFKAQPDPEGKADANLSAASAYMQQQLDAVTIPPAFFTAFQKAPGQADRIVKRIKLGQAVKNLRAWAATL